MQIIHKLLVDSDNLLNFRCNVFVLSFSNILWVFAFVLYWFVCFALFVCFLLVRYYFCFCASADLNLLFYSQTFFSNNISVKHIIRLKKKKTLLHSIVTPTCYLYMCWPKHTKTHMHVTPFHFVLDLADLGYLPNSSKEIYLI